VTGCSEGGEGVEWPKVPNTNKIQLDPLEPGHEGDAPNPQPLGRHRVWQLRLPGRLHGQRGPYPLSAARDGAAGG
jgi:hypothetical protein